MYEGAIIYRIGTLSRRVEPNYLCNVSIHFMAKLYVHLLKVECAIFHSFWFGVRQLPA